MRGSNAARRRAAGADRRSGHEVRGEPRGRRPGRGSGRSAAAGVLVVSAALAGCRFTSPADPYPDPGPPPQRAGSSPAASGSAPAARSGPREPAASGAAAANEPEGQLPDEVFAAIHGEVVLWRTRRRAARSDRARADAGEDDPFAPASFLRRGARPALPHAYFVKVERLEVGGDFDAGGPEEVVVILTGVGRELRAGAAEIDLPSDEVASFSLPGAPLIEVVPSDPVLLDVRIEEEDPHGVERITGTTAPVQIPLAEFGEHGATRAIALAPIESTHWVVVMRRPIVLKGARLHLGLVRVPRRDTLEPVHVGALHTTFAEVLRLPPPRDLAAAAGHGAALRACAARAREAAGRSLHTALRDALGELAHRAERLARQLQIALRASPAAVRGALAELGRAVATIAPRERGPASCQVLFVRAEQLAARGAGLRADADAVSVVADEADALVHAFEDTLVELEAPPPSLFAAVDQLAGYLDAVALEARRELQARRARERMTDDWEDLVEEIEDP